MGSSEVSWADGLRGAQRQAAGFDGADAVLLAGPGTGKTYVLVRRVEFLLEAGIEPDSVLCLTFTRAAAAEMRARLTERLGEELARQVRVATLHSYALSQLLHGDTVNLPEPLRVAGDWEERHVIFDEMKHLLPGRTVIQVRDAFTALSNDWDTLDADRQEWINSPPDPAFLGAWQQHRRVYGYTLRSELVYQLLCEIRADPGLVPYPEPSVILVDEYQDLNLCDLTTIKYLSERSAAEVYVVGDDDQSIYSFRRAAPSGIRSFQREYDNAAELRLVECLRCGPSVVDLANWLISHEPGRINKELRSVTSWASQVSLLQFDDQNDEAESIARAIDADIESGLRPEDVLVLFKSDPKGRNSNLLDEALFALGHSVYLPRAQSDEREDLVKLQQYLLLSLALQDGNTDDLALRCLLELEDNGIGPGTLLGVLEVATNAGIRWTEALELLRNPTQAGPQRRRALLEEAERIVELAGELTPREQENFETWVERVAQTLGLSEESQEVLHQLLQTTASVGDPAADAEAEADPDAEQVERPRAQQLLAALSGLGDALPAFQPGQVTVTTMHGAKGLTAEAVYVLQLEDEIFPGDDVGAAELEARRLLYVSVTRAKRKLVLGYCSKRTGSQQYSRSSRAGSPRRTLTRFLRHSGLVAQNARRWLQNP